MKTEKRPDPGEEAEALEAGVFVEELILSMDVFICSVLARKATKK